MHREFTSKTCSMAGASDLTVVAPICPGLVPALDTVTYKSRVKRVLRALHTGRSTAHEYDLARVLSDAVERVGRIHSVRIAVLEPQDQVLLAVTFDGPWESYVRVIWQKVSRLLDLIFCNTVDYVPGWGSTYEAWGAWLRSRQVETPFLYATPGVTTDDVQYLQMYERLHRRDGQGDARLATAAVPSAEEIADRLAMAGTDPRNLGTSLPLKELVEARPQAFRQGLRSVAGLYRLAELYPPGTPEGGWLLRAAHELLPEFSRLVKGKDVFDEGLDQAAERFRDPLRWFATDLGEPPPEHRRLRPPPAAPALDQPGTIQAGILAPYAASTHGVLVLLSFDTRAALADFLRTFRPTTHDAPQGDGTIVANIALSLEGLRLAGLSEAELRTLPEEFLMGMEKRAGLLGDVRFNHPQRWRLPPLNWAAGTGATEVGDDPSVPRTDLRAVHVLLQLRLLAAGQGALAGASPQQALMDRIDDLVRQPAAAGARPLKPGLRPLSLQWMQRHQSGPHTVEHFGFADAQSDPVLTQAEAGQLFPNHVHAGEALLGYENAADAQPTAPAPGSVAALLHNGSFLVVRKLRQDRRVFEEAVGRAVQAGVDADTFKAKMLGRWPIGHAKAGEPLAPLAPGAKPNDFLFDDEDPAAPKCPMHAHMRRANPRTQFRDELKPAMTEGARPPRLFRRGMGYGPQYVPNPQQAGIDEERGLVFMAYNASIGEQFEVVQRWLSGGNPPGTPSGVGDPLLGHAEPGRKRFFRFEDGGKVVRVELDGSDDLHAEPRPLVRLEWGGYFFAPSTAALALLAAWQSAPALPRRQVPWDAEEGEALIRQLQRIEREQGWQAARTEWKAALEDQERAADFSTASLWAAIRERHHGVLHTPYGVLVARDDLVQQVLQDAPRHLTATGYLPRMRRSFGEIFLGMDEGERYHAEADACTREIRQLDPHEVFTVALQATQQEMERLVAEAKEHALTEEQSRRMAQLPPRDPVAWTLTLDMRELLDHLLATFCEQWFGLSTDGDFFERGGYPWGWTPGSAPPRYPGHFMAPSRYFFQPHPGPEVERIGGEHGQALRAAMEAFLARHGATLQQPIVRAVLDSAAGRKDPALAARTLVGAIMGFAPTVNGSLRRVLAEWLRDNTFWTLRAARDHGPQSDWEKMVDEQLRLALQVRATPEAIWRTASVSHRIGDSGKEVEVSAGETVVIGSLSATQQRVEAGAPGLEPVFGGAGMATPPTHACPGYGAAMAMMKGFVMALLTSGHGMRAGIAPLTLMFEGREPLPVPAPPVPGPAVTERIFAPTLFELAARRFASPVHIWCVGDSWLSNLSDYFFPDLPDELAKLGYVATNEAMGHSEKGRRLEEIAQNIGRVQAALNTANPQPKAIILGGGGNDITKRPPGGRYRDTMLFKVLTARPQNLGSAFNEPVLKEFIDVRLRGYYRTVIDALLQRPAGKPPIPIVIHAYDFPVPDGRGPYLGASAWLHPVFKELEVPGDAHGLRKDIMQALITRLNDMVKDLIATEYAGRPVHHVGFPGILGALPDFGADYTRYWHDELHPQTEGYGVIALVIAGLLANKLNLIPA